MKVVPTICYIPKNFAPKSLRLIDAANDIIVAYRQQGFRLTLRQLYYQFVSRALIPNKQTEYDKLGETISAARLAGMIDWEAIVDLTRELTRNSHWDSPRDIVGACAIQYQIDKWETQENYVEVWIEKDALAGVFEPTCKRLDVPFFSCRGYTSQSSMWEAGQRLKEKAEDGKECHILHFGDHDPSGIDMSRDIEARLSMFMCDPDEGIPEGGEDYFHSQLTLTRIALNMDQVRQYNPPPNPAKVTDTRAEKYIKRFGNESWELDALEPRVLAALIEENVLSLRDEDQWQEAVTKELMHRGAIKNVVSLLPEE